VNQLRQLEQDILAEGREWTRQRLEKRLQEQSDVMPAVCPKTGDGLKDVRWRDLQLMSISGVVKLRVRHGYSPALGQWICPVRQLEELLEHQPERTPEPQELIERAVKFFVKHRDHLHYQALEKAGAPRGSGAVESLGKQLQHRLRGCGQIWSRPGFTRSLKVVVLLKNRDDHLLWN
jgi:hypothetical protein